MANDYFNATTDFQKGVAARAADVNAQFDAVAAGFDLLPSVSEMDAGLTRYLTLAGGTQNYTAALTGYTTYTEGDSFKLKVNATNTSTSTLNIESVGAIAIKNADLTDTQAGDLLINSVVTVTYNGTVFVLQSNSANAASSAAAAATSEANAAASEALANQWATEAEDVPVSGGEYSAYHWAQKSAASANEVLSVNGQTGTVVLNYGAAGNLPETVTTDKTLTSSNSGYQIVTGAYAITLPDATTLTKGAMTYQIENQHTANIVIRNDAGIVLFLVKPNKTLIINLTDNSTANGTWTDLLYDSDLGKQYAAVNVDTDDTRDPGVLTISSTQAIAYYVDVTAGNHTFLCLLTINADGTITPGTPYQVTTSARYYPILVELESNKYFLTHTSGSTTIYGHVITLTGSTFSKGSEYTLSTNASFLNSTVVLNSTNALIVYKDTASPFYLKAQVIPRSGDVLTTTGTPVVVSGTSVPYSSRYCVQAISATQAIVAYVVNGGLSSEAHVIDISGTTITTNTIYTIDNTSTSQQGFVLGKLTSSLFVFAYYGNDGSVGTFARVLSVSGTVVTIGDIAVIDRTEINYPSVIGASSTEAIVCGRNTALYGSGEPEYLSASMHKLKVSGTDISVGSIFDATTEKADGAKADLITGNRYVLVFENSTPYFRAKAVEFIG